MQHISHRIALSTAAALALAACGDTRQPLAPEAAPTPLLGASGAALDAPAGAPAARPIPGQYVVVFADRVHDAPGLARQLVAAHGGSLRHVYGHALRGFAARLPEAAAAALARNPNVALVEQDQVVRAFATQSNAPWGLDRSDQRDLPLSGSYIYTPTGAGVTLYVIDTGIRFDHVELGGRASRGYDAIGDGQNGADCNGHGTHVAGTAAGATYGVAKRAALVSVRVLDCDGGGTLSGVIAGIDWVTANAVKPAVANVSLGGGASQALDDAVSASVAAGVTYAIAAGNDNADACTYSPARVAAAITVGATTSADARAGYSNFGGCLDLFAPGTGIRSAWHTSSSATATSDGTSMATPHAAGVAALYLERSPAASPADVASALTSTATSGRLTGVGAGSPNRLLYAPLTKDGSGPCTACTAYSGSLSGGGDYDYQPSGTHYYSGASGYQKGWLSGPSTADFDLYLYKWNGWKWALVARSESGGSEERISYYGSAGYYLWEVYSYSGAGSYTFWLQKP